MLNPTTIEERIKYCISQVGTQVEFVRRSSVSRSQLSRYLDGGSKPSIDKLADMAEVSGVDLGWLVTGSGTPCKSENVSLSFSYDLIGHVIQIFEETLMEYQGQTFTPKQKAIMIPLIQACVEHEKHVGVFDGELDRTDMVDRLDFLSCVNKSNMLERYKDLTFRFLSVREEPVDEKEIGTFVNAACNATIESFSMEVGEHYCQRTKDIINTYARKNIFKVMETLFGLPMIQTQATLNMLDLGCGSGRYMHYIHQNYERIKVHGIEPAKLPFDACKQKEMSGQLPEGSVVQADARNLPYKAGSMDFVMSKAVLHWLPYFKTIGFGTKQAFSEVARVLKPGGAFYFDTRHGSGHREFVPFNQTYSKADVQRLAAEHGFKILWIHTDSDPYFPELVEDVGDVSKKYSDFISVFAVKL